MNITRIVGSVEEEKGIKHARIKVHSFKKDGKTISGKNEIVEAFPPFGYVFAPNLLDELNISLFSVVEFYASRANFKRDSNHDEFIVQNLNEVKLVGFQIFEVAAFPLVSELSVDQSKLKWLVEADAFNFYMLCGQYLYGPFKKDQLEIVPKVGTEILRFESRKDLQIRTGSNIFLLKQPETVLARIDCMTIGQLADWMKNYLFGVSENFDFKRFKKTLQSQSLVELNKARLERAINFLDQLSLNKNDLSVLAQNSEKFATVFDIALRRIELEIKEDFIEPLEKRRKILRDEINSLENKQRDLLKLVDDGLIRLESLDKSYNFLLNNRDRLVEEIRATSLINPSRFAEKLKTFEEITTVYSGEPYSSLIEFIETLTMSFRESPLIRGNFLSNMTFQLKNFRCILSNAVQPIIQFAKISGNSKVYIQQVEADWLKFERFYENGLEQAWSSASSDFATMHFLVLEDINIASIECYGRPILDLLSGIRKILPGLKTPWPANLWIFGIPGAKRDGDDFYLSLNKGTFENWAAFANVDPPYDCAQVTANKRLTLETLTTHDIFPSNHLSDYF